MITLDEMDAEIAQNESDIDVLEAAGRDVSQAQQRLESLKVTRYWMAETFALTARSEKLTRQFGEG